MSTIEQVSPSIAQDPARLLPADPATRSIAARLLAVVEGLPILSPHGHVPASVLARNERFPDPARLLVTPDHYVTRLLHANGSRLDDLGLGPEPAAPRDVWRTFCRAWPILDGTASSYWLRRELVEVFGVDDALLDDRTGGEAAADALFDTLEERLASPAFRPRALAERFGIEVLATTDDPLDDLDDHAAIAADAGVRTRVIPTFRPDAYLQPHAPGWAERVDRLIATAGGGSTGYDGYLAALASRRQYFIDHGAVSADHGSASARTLDLDRADAARLFEAARAGTLDTRGAADFEAHLLLVMATMSVDDGLVMTLHPGVYRNHHRATFERYGPDTGHAIPVAVEFTRSLAPLLSRVGTARGFRLVLFSIDETTYSRELAPLAGFYPSVYLGAPWWFLDAPDAMRRVRSAITETAGFSRSSGFVDDTRAFASIPARHDASRRVEAGMLASYVVERRLSEERAAEILVDLVDGAPRRVFGL